MQAEQRAEMQTEQQSEYYTAENLSESLLSDQVEETPEETKPEESGSRSSLRSWLDRLRRTLPGGESSKRDGQAAQASAESGESLAAEQERAAGDASLADKSTQAGVAQMRAAGDSSDGPDANHTRDPSDEAVESVGAKQALSTAQDQNARTGVGENGGNEAAQDERAAEALLVMQAKQDPEAFGVLYERYVDRIYSYIYHRVGSSQDAEDLTARTFYRALDKLESYEDRGLPFSAWLFRIAHNLMANWHRDRSRRRFLSLDRLWFYGNNRQSPETLVEEEEKHEALWTAIERLPEDRKNLLVLKFGSQLSNLEIGNLMEKSESAIKSLYFRTLASLREDLEKRGWGIDMMRRPEILDEPVAEPNRGMSVLNDNREPGQSPADGASSTPDAMSLSDQESVSDQASVSDQGGDK
jgi:RNA polymerase sigma-70 factor, ECF subfamily